MSCTSFPEPSQQNGTCDWRCQDCRGWRARLAAMGYELTDQESADLVVVERMTDELRWYVQNGGKVLWLAEEPDSRADPSRHDQHRATAGQELAGRLGQQHELDPAGQDLPRHSHRRHG